MDVNVASLERRLERSAKALASNMAERDQAICELAAVGVRLDRICELSGLSKGRVSQIVKKARTGNATP
jgi:DNA-directed RNA polymerase specialized sigma subunit